MSLCPLCNHRMTPGIGHSCSKTYGDTSGHYSVAPSVVPRIAAPKTWRQLEQLAAEQHLRLFRTSGCVTVETLDRVPYVTITTDRIDRDEDADRVVRAALSAALEALRSVRP